MRAQELVEKLKARAIEPVFPAFLDATALSLWKGCPRKFFWQALLSQRPKGRNTHLHAGGVYAEAHETCRRHVYSGGSLEEGLVLGAVNLIQGYGDFEPPEDGPPSMQAKRWDRVLAAFVTYYDRWHPRDDVFIPVALPNGKPGVEYSFSVPVGIPHPVTGEDILYAGRFDLLTHMCPKGWRGSYTEEIVNSPIFGLDDKTTHSMGASWAKQWRHRSQFIGYTWAQQELGVNVRGFVVRGAGIKKTQIDHEQCIVMHPKWKVEEWHNMTLDTIGDIVVAWEQGRFHSVYDDACNSYGACSYAPLCDAPNPIPVLMSEYEEVHWNPVSEET